MRRSFVSALLLACAALLLFGGAAEAKPKKKRNRLPAKVPAAFVGVVPQTHVSAGEYGQMKRAGIRRVRVMFHRGAIESGPGVYNWASTDQLIGDAAKHGLTTFPFLYGSPAWSAFYDRIPCPDGDCSIVAPASDYTRHHFGAFAASAVQRYGPNGTFWKANPQLPYRPIRTWQIWNEMNSPKYWAPQVDAASYVALLAAASHWIKSVDPSARIVLGGVWGPQSAAKVLTPAKQYFKAIYKAGGAAHFDDLAVHPYGGKVNKVLAQIKEARRVANGNGDRKAKIWITEFGYASSGPKGSDLVKGKKGQARALKDTYRRLGKERKKLGITAAFWYAWRDTPADVFICAWCNSSGLLNVGGKAKPALKALKSIIKR